MHTKFNSFPECKFDFSTMSKTVIVDSVIFFIYFINNNKNISSKKIFFFKNPASRQHDMILREEV